jgi:galactokinase
MPNLSKAREENQLLIKMLTSQEIPFYTLKELESLYPPHSNINQRYEILSLKFIALYGDKPDFFARSPGRVNLMGEHIDYSGFSVLPMAIENDTIIAVKVRESKTLAVKLNNIQPLYSPVKFNHQENENICIDHTRHEWSNYFKCGYKGVLEELRPTKWRSMDVLVDGNVPAGSGLSSSSSLVCCSALATLNAYQGFMTKDRVTEIAIKSEGYAGVLVGGMDQSISILARRGCALLIDFVPKLDATFVDFPQSDSSIVFVVANTLVIYF